MEYLVPTETNAILQNNADRCCNLALILGRYIPREVICKEDVPNERNVKWLNKWLPGVLKQFTSQNIGATQQAVYARWQQTVAATRATPWTMPLITRLIVGLGGKGALEIGITLDKVTGLPFVPGSALKGLCRSYALYTLAEKYGVPIEKEAFASFDEELTSGKYDSEDLARTYHRAFGTQEGAGVLVFFDAVVAALPPGNPLFALDVMTPHFPKYYTSSGKDSPADNDSPNPVNFIAVAHRTTFAFAVGVRAGVQHADTQDVLAVASGWLQTALQDFGVGSKTAAGYGAFGPVKA